MHVTITNIIYKLQVVPESKLDLPKFGNAQKGLKITLSQGCQKRPAAGKTRRLLG